MCIARRVFPEIGKEILALLIMHHCREGCRATAKHASDVHRYVWSTLFTKFPRHFHSPLYGCHTVSTVVDINNDEKATGNHSEETVVSSYVVLLVIARCICIVFSDDLSLLAL
jgi:hypothetical protein